MIVQFGGTLDKIRNPQYWPCHSGNDDLNGCFMMRYIRLYIYIAFDDLRSRENIAFLLNFGSAQVNFLGVLNDTSLGSCGGAGWKLVMKMKALNVPINISTIEINKALYIGCRLLPII